MTGLRGSRPIPRIDEECSEAIAARWVAEGGVPALYATSAYFSMKTTQVQKGSGYSVSWCSNFMKAIMNHLSQQECLMKWNDFCGKGRRLTQTLAAVASENSMKEKAAPILKHFIDPEIVKVIIDIWESMTALTKDIHGQPGTNAVSEDQTVGASLTLWLKKSEKRFTAFRDALRSEGKGVHCGQRRSRQGRGPQEPQMCAETPGTAHPLCQVCGCRC